MSDFDKENMFGPDDFEGFNNDKDGFRKLEELLSQMFGPKGFESENSRKEDDEDRELEESFGDPASVEVIIKGEWTITITTWKRDNGITTEKVELEGPSKTIPQEIQDFIKDRINSKKGAKKEVLKSSENIEALIDGIFADEKKKYVDENKFSKINEEDFANVGEIAKFWFFHRAPEFDELIEDALTHEEYEKAAYLRDKKKNLDVFNQVTLDRLGDAVAKGDFVAIDSIMAAYKSRLPSLIKL